MPKGYCTYKFRGGETCGKTVYEGSLCILHTPLPDKENPDFKKITELKDTQVKDKIAKEDFNFEGVKLHRIDFNNLKIKGDLIFYGATIGRDARFIGAEIGGDARFIGAKIGGAAMFDGVKIGGDAWFNEVKIGRAAMFDGAKIGGTAWFNEAKVGRDSWFIGAKIGGDAWFDRVTIGGDAWFYEAKIGGDAHFSTLNLKGTISFDKTFFEELSAKEEACRKAKKVHENFGDYHTADEYYYLEMNARRRQKRLTFSLKKISNLIKRLKLNKYISKEISTKEREIYSGWVEWPIDKIFRYGTKWHYVLITWIIVVFSLGLFFWISNGVVGSESKEIITSIWDNLYFSIVTATTLGYGDFRPNATEYFGIPVFRLLAGGEAIFGTFMVAAFIVIFARKYMR